MFAAETNLCNYIVFCRTDQTRWLEALTHPAKEKQKEDEKIYETWGNNKNDY